MDEDVVTLSIQRPGVLDARKGHRACETRVFIHEKREKKHLDRNAKRDRHSGRQSNSSSRIQAAHVMSQLEVHLRSYDYANSTPHLHPVLDDGLYVR
jgi:hypothetical protein